MYGNHIGDEGATETSCPASGSGWQPYTNSEGEASKYFDTDIFTSDEAKNIQNKNTTDGFYDSDPNLKQYWPIPQTTITNSQGSLKNDYGY